MNKKMLPMVIILALILFLSVSTISAANVTISQVTNSSGTVKTYVETNHTLPSNVNVSGNQVNTAQYLKLETAAVININNKTNTTIPITTVNKPAAPSQTITTTNITKTEYINIANTVQNFININGAAPNYATQTSTGKTIRYESLVYMYSQILSSYKINGILPSYITVNPWSVVSNSTTKSFSIAQIKNASITVKSYVDKNHALPSTVNIDGYNVNMYTYLYLASTSVQNVYNNNPSSVTALSYKPPEAYREDVRQGYMSKSEYIHIADVVKVYMDKTGYVPGYAYGTSLGSYFGWKSMIYMYSSILGSTTTSLPSSITVKPWRILSDPNWAIFSNDQVLTAANNVKNSIETNKQLPSTVTVNGKQISTYSFLYLMSTVVQNLYNHNNNPVYSMSFNGPQASNDAIYTGNMALAEYINIADQVKVYMDKTRITPGYAYGTSLGTYFGWKSMTYMYTKILASYSAQKLLPSAIYVKPIKALSDSSAIISPPKMEVIVTGTGGDITKNYPIMQNIPKTYITTKIIELAKNGTPMITFGNGTGPKVMITAGVHGNELPAQIAAIKLINYLYGMKISGTIYIVPFIAPSSTSTTTRFWNGQNLNSIANIAGTPTNQIKNLALRLKVNALGDFHSSQPGGVPGKNSALCSKSPTYGSYLIASYIAGQTGSALIAYNRAGVDYPGALEDVTNLAGIPAVTCEVLSSHGTVASGSVSISYNQMMAFLRYYGIP